MDAIVRAFVCILVGVFAVGYACRACGRDMAWIGRHLAALIAAAACVAYAAGYAAEKPPGPEPPPPAQRYWLRYMTTNSDGNPVPTIRVEVVRTNAVEAAAME